MNTGDNIAEVNFNNLLAQFMLMAMMTGLAEGMSRCIETPRYAPATVWKSPEIDLTGTEKPAKISSIEPFKSKTPGLSGLSPNLRRQGERYIRRWTEAMYTPKSYGKD